ncbi:ABC transporter ATP-binding protein [Bacteroidetes/Chlorobi group bacterium ChocPot_Mid]|jgi:putative ABC transport system ATP-binding protein|nr:MAG: ABC transporter ATP-binding protein [Bacteroidetes/Chlorobi group bacterium ChocPot_Mid]
MIIETKELTKNYHHKDGLVVAIKNINLNFEQGDFVTITGPSGSGKTTLLLLLAGLIRPTSGRITFKGYDLHSASDNKLANIRSKHIGFIMQNFSLIPYLSVLNNVLIPLSLNQNGENTKSDYAVHLLESIGLKDRMNHLPKELSAGQQQRVAIARALVNKPNLILADEPTGNLDPALAIEILEVLKQINIENKITIIMVTHSPTASEYGNVRVHIKDGSIII